MIDNFPEKKNIFVIHSEKDNYLIKELEGHFKNIFFGITNFKIDYLDSSKGNYLGDDFGKIIRKKIRESEWRLIIITKNSRCSPWVNQEIGYSFKVSGKRSLVMIQKELLKKPLGFIHSNIDAQPFTYGEFHIEKIEDKLIERHGEKIQLKYIKDIVDVIKPKPQNSKIKTKKLKAEVYVV